MKPGDTEVLDDSELLSIAKRLIEMCENAIPTLVWFYMGPYGSSPDLNISEWRGELGNLKTSLADVALNKRADVDTTNQLKRKLNMFKPWGTDGCRKCETGRITLFVANTECMDCNPKSYEPVSTGGET